MKSLRSTRQARASVAGWVAAAIVSVFATSAAAQYRIPPAVPITPSVGVATALESPEIWAQAAAYDQYLLYLSSVNRPPASGQALDSPYSRNGATVTGVPSAGEPGSAYFNNGAEATTVPSAGPRAAYFSNGAEATRFPLATPTPSAPPPPLTSAPPGPLETPPPTTPPSETPPFAPPAARTPAVAVMDEPPMSFEQWIESMRATAPASPASASALAANGARTEAPPITESSESANEMRPRRAYDLAEKAAERAPARKGSRRWAPFVAGAFALGLLSGVLAKRRGRARNGSARRS